jgi:hypothetical protein
LDLGRPSLHARLDLFINKQIRSGASIPAFRSPKKMARSLRLLALCERPCFFSLLKVSILLQLTYGITYDSCKTFFPFTLSSFRNLSILMGFSSAPELNGHQRTGAYKSANHILLCIISHLSIFSRFQSASSQSSASST